MESSQILLEGASDMEKGAYIGAIASLATADRQATEDEIEYLKALCEGTKLSDEQTAAVLKAATEISNEDVKRCLDVLKNSDLRFSLITDLIAFAKTDNTYSEQEQQNVQKMAQYLGVDQKQYSLLDNFAQQATSTKATPEQIQSPGFLSSIGLKDKLESAGINGNGLLKGLLGIAAPLILARMVSGGRHRGFGGGMFGNSGGMFGGGGGMLGGGGLGSLIGMLSGGRGMGSMGGLFGGLFGGNRGW
jgi:uncharacterized tellurite resistance protein B-like protein